MTALLMADLPPLTEEGQKRNEKLKEAWEKFVLEQNRERLERERRWRVDPQDLLRPIGPLPPGGLRKREE